MLPSATRAEAMARAGFDLVIARTPEHVLYLSSGHWPVSTGPACALATADQLTLIVPEGELDWIPPGFGGAVRDFSVVHDEERLMGGEDALLEAIPTAIDELDVPGPAYGIDAGVDLVAPTVWSGKTRVLSALWRDRLIARLGRDIADATPMLAGLRAVKTATEVDRIRAACDVAESAVAAALAELDEGTTEAALAAAVEFHVHASSSGEQRRRCYAAVMSGPQAANAGTHFNVSSDRPMLPGRPALIEVGVCVEGYWADITRGFTLGEPAADARDWALALEAIRAAALDCLVPGATLAHVARLARDRADELLGDARTGIRSATASDCATTSPRSSTLPPTRSSNLAWCSRWSPASISPAAAGCASKTSTSSPRTGRSPFRAPRRLRWRLAARGHESADPQRALGRHRRRPARFVLTSARSTKTGVEALWRRPDRRAHALGSDLGPEGPRSIESWDAVFVGGWFAMLPSAGMPGELDGTPTRLHGEVARLPWELLEHTQTSIVARVRTATGPLEVVRTVALDGADLVLRTAFTNAGEAPLAYLYGEHPCFSLATFAGGWLTVGVEQAWVPTPPLMPKQATLRPGPLRWPMAQGSRTCQRVDCSALPLRRTGGMITSA